ncbi:MAG: DUF1570 domain-containing protein [Planctomycetota bacterium]
MLYPLSRSRWFWLALVLLAASCVARAAHAIDLDTHESEHYLIHTNLPVEEIRPLAQHMDQMFEEYARRFRELLGGRTDQTKSNIYLLATQRDYQETLAQLGVNGNGSGGMFFVRNRQQGLATWVNDRPRRQVIQILQHEGFHQFAYQHIGTELPVWVNEGLAVYFEQALLVNGRFRTGLAEAHRIVVVKSALDDGYAFSLESLMNMNGVTWRANLTDSERAPLQYAQSWSICYFLIHGDNGRYQRAFNRYLELVASGRSNERAFETAFGTSDYDAMAERWRAFVEEDLEPDDYTTMVSRLEFLANGVVAATAAGEDAFPETFEDYQALLQQAGFAMHNSLTGERITAQDEGVFTYNDSRGRTHAFEYELDNETGRPMISANRCRPRARIEWKTDSERLSFRIVFD